METKERISHEKIELKLLLKSTKVIGIDIDGTLSDTISAALSEVRSRYGDIMSFSDWKTWNPHQIRQLQEVGITEIDQTIEIFYTILKKNGSQPVYPITGSTDGIQRLKNMKKSLIALSGRMEDSRDYTEGWLTENYGKVFDQVLLTDHDTPKQVPKYELAQKHGIGIMIEDNAHYALELAKNHIPTILLEAPWNIDIDVSLYPNIFRVKDWNEIINLLDIFQVSNLKEIVSLLEGK